MIHKKISVIIPAYNAESTIESTLESVLNQTYQNLEIIVVNDGSTDRTLAVLAKYATKIKLISTANKGVSHARNTGLKYSKGEFIQYLDADDLLIENKIEIQLKALEAESGDVAYGNWQSFMDVNGVCKIKETNSKQLKKYIEVEIFTDFWCPPAALLYTKEIVDKIGGWKEWLPIIQDARYMLDAAMHNGKFVYCPFLVAQYRTGLEHSLSNKNSLAFVKDVFTNTKDVWMVWQYDIKNLKAKKAAIIQSLRYCIHEFSILDQSLFEEAIKFLLKISPKYIPSQSGLLKILSVFLGYRNAEKFAGLKRKLWH